MKRSNFIILVVLVLAFSFQLLAFSCFSSENGLVGWWNFDEGKGMVVKDSSGLGNNGMPVKAKFVPGRSGTALSFTESGSYVKIPSRPSMNLGDAISMEAWIYPIDISRDSRIILSKNDEYLMRIDRPSEGNKISSFLMIGTPAVAWEPRISSKTIPETNAWQLVTVTWDGAKIVLYVNGESISQRNRVGRSNPDPYPLMIGNWEYPACHGVNFGGLIDEVKLYNRALTPGEVRSHFQNMK